MSRQSVFDRRQQTVQQAQAGHAHKHLRVLKGLRPLQSDQSSCTAIRRAVAVSFSDFTHNNTNLLVTAKSIAA